MVSPSSCRAVCPSGAAVMKNRVSYAARRDLRRDPVTHVVHRRRPRGRVPRRRNSGRSSAPRSAPAVGARTSRASRARRCRAARRRRSRPGDARPARRIPRSTRVRPPPRTRARTRRRRAACSLRRRSFRGRARSPLTSDRRGRASPRGRRTTPATNSEARLRRSMHTSTPGGRAASRTSMTVAASLGVTTIGCRLPPVLRQPLGRFEAHTGFTRARALVSRPRASTSALIASSRKAAGSAIGQACGPSITTPSTPAARRSSSKAERGTNPSRSDHETETGMPESAIDRTSSTRSARRMNSPVADHAERVDQQIQRRSPRARSGAGGTVAASRAGLR